VIVKLELPIELTQEEDLTIAICPVFCVGSQGKTEEEAMDNARIALELYLEDEDVQKQHARTILDYAVSFSVSDEEKEFMEKNNIKMPEPKRAEHIRLLDVEIHGNPEASKPIGI
jgi:predicted RNase H-like HicB family nuclease